MLTCPTVPLEVYLCPLTNPGPPTVFFNVISPDLIWPTRRTKTKTRRNMSMPLRKKTTSNVKCQ